MKARSKDLSSPTAYATWAPLTIFWQLAKELLAEKAELLRLPHRAWKVQFTGEGVDDCGGGYSESVVEICEELQHPNLLQLLISTPNGKNTTGVNQDCFILNPGLLQQANSEAHHRNFSFLGVLLGIAIRSGAPLSLSLAPTVWKQLVGVPLNVGDLAEIDCRCVPSLLYLRDMDSSALDSMELPFSTSSAR